ncbi:MAG: phosphoglucosamine mutase [Vicinamibacterales bacterium]
MKLFGTDGIRGEAGVAPLDPETIARVGAALVRTHGGRGLRVLVGRDTRESGPWIEDALTRGCASAGAEVGSLGVVPTPAVAYLTRADGFDLGVVISASHNPYRDNGIKVFSGAGEKFTEAAERAVEAAVADPTWEVGAGSGRHARPRRDLIPHYVDHLRRVLADAGPLRGTRLVVDCANGATSELAPSLLAGLGFVVEPIGVDPDGRNINRNCGSTALGLLQGRVREVGAALGVAFDGDGDRALFVDHEGRRVDGDAVMLVCADQLRREGRLAGDALVATVMSNIGLDLALKARGVSLVRCPVGDKHVMEEMLRRGLSLGGEQSGHVIFADHLYTGDGIATALHVLRTMAATGESLASLASSLVTYPQVLLNVRVRERVGIETIPAIADAIHDVERRLDGQGRLLVRYSGTEPLLRIMLEGRDQAEIQAWAEEIAAVVRTHLG